MIQSQLATSNMSLSSTTTTATPTRVPLLSAPTNTCEVFNSNNHSTFEEEVFKQLQPMQKKSSNKVDIAAQQQRQTAEIVANYTAYNHNHNHSHQHHLQSQSIPVAQNQKQHRVSVICKREELSTRLNNTNNNRSVDNPSANKDNNKNSNNHHQQANFQLQYQEEFNRMRERLFRLLSKVPIQVESVADCAQDSSSAAFAATSTGSSSMRSIKKHDREPLLIKYYNDRALGEILEQHFGCSLIKHNYEHGLPLNTHIERTNKANLTHNQSAQQLQQQQQQYTCSPVNHLISVSNSITDPFACSMMISSSQINQPYEQHHEQQLQVQQQQQQLQQHHQQQLLIQQPKYLNQTSYSEWPSGSHSAANMTAYEWQIPTYDLDALKMAFVSERSTANANCANNRRSNSSTVKDGSLYERHSSATVVPANRRQKQSNLALNRQVTKSAAVTATTMSNQSSPSTGLHSNAVYSHNNHLQQQLSQQQALDSFKQQHPADCKLKYSNQSNNTFVAADIFSNSHLTEIASATTATTTITTPTTTTTATTTTNAITSTANNASAKGTTTSNSNSATTSQANSQRPLSYELSHLSHSANNYINHHQLQHQQQPVNVTNNLHIYTTTPTPYLSTTDLSAGSQQLLDDCQPSLSFTQTTSEHNHSPSASSSTSSSLLHHNNSSSSYCHQHSSSILPPDNLLIVGSSYEQVPADALEQQQLSESYYQNGGGYLQMHNFIGHPAGNDWHLCHTTNAETSEQHSQLQQQPHMIEQQQTSTEIQTSENYCNRQRNGFYQNQELTSYVVYTTNDCQQTGVGLENGVEGHQ